MVRRCALASRHKPAHMARASAIGSLASHKPLGLNLDSSLVLVDEFRSSLLDLRLQICEQRLASLLCLEALRGPMSDRVASMV